MKKTLIIFASLAMAATVVFGQEMYKCPDPSGSGAILFQNKPCPLDGSGPQINATPTPQASIDADAGVVHSESSTASDALLERQRRNAEVAGSLSRQDFLHREGGLAGLGGGDAGSGRRGPVHVRSYTRSDGTAVRSYTRSLPSR